jgi:acyl carrier protein
MEEVRETGALARSAAGPLSDLESRLADLWKESLLTDQVGPDDHFLDLGGDSIRAMMILNRIERLWGARLSPTTFFRHPTVRQLATLIEGRTPAFPRNPVVDRVFSLSPIDRPSLKTTIP